MIEEIFGFAVVLTTSIALFIIGITRLGLRSPVLTAVSKELAQCVVASILFFLMNTAIGVLLILLIRAVGPFIALYAMANWTLALFSLAQGFLFQMWWRGSH